MLRNGLDCWARIVTLGPTFHLIGYKSIRYHFEEVFIHYTFQRHFSPPKTCPHEPLHGEPVRIALTVHSSPLRGSYSKVRTSKDTCMC